VRKKSVRNILANIEVREEGGVGSAAHGGDRGGIQDSLRFAFCLVVVVFFS